ncbi:MAG: hypoxanthine phosphoribosyltransferase [Rubripirellula sp.]
MRTLLTETQLRDGVIRLGSEIEERYRGQTLTMIAVMTGSLVLLADLMRLVKLPLRIGVIQASSYRGGMSSGELATSTEMLLDIADRDVLLVDDIFDTGKTLNHLTDVLKQRGASSVRSAVLLHKMREHEVTMRPNYSAFQIPDEFVVGYGLDYLDMFRNLPHLAVLEPEDIEDARRQAKS